MSLSWVGRNRSLEVSPKARLVDEAEVDALLRKREALQWKPENGFLTDHVQARAEDESSRRTRAA